jgi:tetratricopeptide (TPR) repeat protein
VIRHDKLIIALLFVVPLLIFARTWQFDFVYYDDQDYVFANPKTLAGLTPANIRWAFTTSAMSNWHPLTWLSYMLDVTVFGPRPGAMHVVNAVIHCLNGVLLFLALRDMTGALWRSAGVAALFALHPLHVESVAWIAERKDVLCTFFGLLAVLAYIRYARAGSGVAYCLTITAFALSLMSKPMLVTLPFLLLVLDFWPLRRAKERNQFVRLVLEKLPLIALAGASCWVTLVVQEGAMAKVPLQVRMINAAVSYVRYLFDMIWPVNLAVLYPMPRVHSQLMGLLASLFLLGVTVLALCQARRYPHLLAGWLWYMGTLVPVIGIVAIGELARADRYTYFPLTGIFIMIAWSVPAPRTIPGTAALSAGGAAILIAFSALTWRQVGYWRNSETVFERGLSIVGSHPTLLQNYGTALSAMGKHERAVELYRKALELRPRWSKPLNNLGYSLLQLGRTAEAVECYRAAIAADPQLAKAYMMLGTTLAREGDVQEGERLLREAVRLAPDRADARRMLNEILTLQGKPPE